MTPDDRSKLARIAAWQEFTGHSQAQIESYLHSVASGLTQTEIDRAMEEGRIGLGIASLLNNPANYPTGLLAAAVGGQKVQGYAAVIRYQTGPDVETDWRTVTATLTPGQSFTSALSEMESAIGSQRQDKHYGRYAPGGVLQAPMVVFAVPVFTTG